MKKVLICGSRIWADTGKIRKEMYALSKSLKAVRESYMVIEGDAKGADHIAGYIADEWGFPHVKVPANWEFYGHQAGPIRNRWMLDLEPDLVLAFHNNIAESKGTKDCVDEARRRGIEVRVFK